METPKHKLTLTNGAARWLGIYINAQGIFTTVADVFNMGVLASSHLESALNLKKEDTEGEPWEKWSKEPHEEFEITEAQRETIKRGFQELAKKGALVVNKFTLELLTAFGMDK